MCKKCLVLMIVVVFGVVSGVQAGYNATYSVVPGATTLIPDSGGQLMDGVYAAMPADDMNVFNDAAVGYMNTGTSGQDQFVTMYVDLGAVKSLSSVTFNYWSGTNVMANGLSYICGPYSVRYSFTDQANPNITNPADDTGWDRVELITQTDVFTKSDWGPHHYATTLDISSAGSSRWIKMEIMPQNAWYGSRLLVMDEVEVTGIPEPITIALLGCGSLALLRRKKHNS